MISEAQRFWDAIVGKVRKVAQDESKNAFRCERYEVTTAPNGSKIGVTLPLGSKEIFLPYSSEVSGAAVGSQVLVVWWGSMSNAKVYYYADGYRGCIFPIGYIYISVSDTDPGTIFGGTWERIQDAFLLAAGTNHSAGSTGGAETVTLTAGEIPSHTHGEKTLTGGWEIGTARIGGTTTPSGIISNKSRETTAYFATASSGSTLNTVGFNVNATHTHDSVGGGGAHDNMPPYLTVYMWKRIA